MTGGHGAGTHHGKGGPHHGGGGPHHGRTTDEGDTSGTLADWFANVENYEGTADRTGQSAVTVTVGSSGNGGAFAYDPPAIRIDRGTTVTWEWTGDGGGHDVVAVDGTFESELASAAGTTFTHTFDEAGTHRYYCTPHRSLGMKGAVVVE
jgi:halocyanin-like protein